MSVIVAESVPKKSIAVNGQQDVFVKFNGVQKAFIEVAGIGPQGPPGAGVDFVFGETPSGLVNGSNATFTTAFDFIPESVIPSINGLEQKVGTHFITMGTNQIIFNDSPTTGEIITVTYIKAN